MESAHEMNLAKPISKSRQTKVHRELSAKLVPHTEACLLKRDIIQQYLDLCRENAVSTKFLKVQNVQLINFCTSNVKLNAKALSFTV